MQVYRPEDGKLAETWLLLQPLGSSCTDGVAQEHWTSPPPIISVIHDGWRPVTLQPIPIQFSVAEAASARLRSIVLSFGAVQLIR
jgi:hypothetical protein